MTPDIEQLLRMGANAARNGNRAAARALFLALCRERPDDARVWVGLAGVAADRDEQRGALERALAIDPSNPVALAALAREAGESEPPPPGATLVLPETILAQADVDAAPPASAADEIAPPAAPGDREEPAPPARFPLLNLILGAVILALLVAVGVILGQALLAGAQPQPGPTPVFQPQPDPSAVAAATLPPATLPPATQPATAAASPIVTAPPATSAAITPSAQASPTPAALQLGTVLDVDGWSITLLRPDYALLLDGAVGGIQPAGRFALALLAVSNNAGEPRRIPDGLLALSDAQGRRYSPAPGVSSAFLSAYGRGEYGDLALEDEIAASSGVRSVPVLFDVPPDATGLTLTVSGAGPVGWPIDGGVIAPAGP